MIFRPLLDDKSYDSSKAGVDQFLEPGGVAEKVSHFIIFYLESLNSSPQILSIWVCQSLTLSLDFIRDKNFLSFIIFLTVGISTFGRKERGRIKLGLPVLAPGSTLFYRVSKKHNIFNLKYLKDSLTKFIVLSACYSVLPYNSVKLILAFNGSLEQPY